MASPGYDINLNIKAIDYTKPGFKSVKKNLSSLKAEKTEIDATNSSLKQLTKNFEKANKEFDKFFKSIGRIAVYRAIRSALKAITQGIGEGVQNLYQFSSLLDGRFMNTMDNLSSSFLYLKNSLGALAAPLINALAPAIDFLIDKFIALLNVINQVFSLLNGATSWTKAVRTPKKYMETVASGAKKAEEAIKKLGLAQIDELTILDKSKAKDNGGGASTPDYSSMFEEVDFLNAKLKELGMKMAFNIKDVLFNWDNLTPENISMKAIAGLGALLGGAAGFVIGGVPGAIIGTLLGFTLGIVIDSLIFNNDGVLSRNEIGEMLRMALFALCGGVIGFIVGKGASGALIGATIGMSLYGLVKGIQFFSDSKDDTLLTQLTRLMGVMTGAAIGFQVGGPYGAAVGAIIGLGLSLDIENFFFNDTSGWSTTDWIKNIIGVLAPIGGALIGFTVGGPAGAAIGALIGLGIKFDLTTHTFKDGQDTGKGFFEGLLAQSSFGILFTIPMIIGQIVDKFKEKLGIHSPSTVFESIGSDTMQGFWNGLKEKINSLMSWIEEKVNKLKNIFNFTWKFPEIQLPHIPTPHFVMETGVFGIQYPKFTGWYAKGGFPETGSLFMANEAGPELVGTMNGRTAVANNDQIVAGIQRGVYEAMMSAMSSGSFNANVYLDGKQITDSVVRNVNNEARRTGMSPLEVY